MLPAVCQHGIAIFSTGENGFGSLFGIITQENLGMHGIYEENEKIKAKGRVSSNKHTTIYL